MNVADMNLVFDVGAAGGGLAWQCARLGVKCVCVEPRPEACASLQELVPDAIVIQKALGPEIGTADLTLCGTLSTLVPEKWFGRKSRFRGVKPGGALEVEVTTLDALIEEHGVPDFVDVDVEGYELEVLQGLSQPVPLLSFEYAPPFLQDARDCLEHLAGLGMTEFNYMNGDCVDGFQFEWEAGLGILKKLPGKPNYGMLFAREVA